ncbi:MAG: hypothetical protein ACKVP0_14470 [Pirellulaceae bacterium]
MIKTIGFDSHKFNVLPKQLCQSGTAVPLDEIDVDIDDLCHQLFHDCHGPVPSVNPAVAYFLALLSSSTAFEFAGDGPGTHKEIRIGESNKYGKAFCRWFLYTHLGITYFAHIDNVLRAGLPVPYNTWNIRRLPGKGDAPDYVCAGNTNTILLGEAKGRQSAVTWDANKGPFVAWRKQFDRLEVRNPSGTVVKLKGYIAAAVMRNQSHKKLQSKLIVEDPETVGERPINDEEGFGLRLSIMAHHYSDILERLAQPVHAAYLRSGLGFHEEINREALVWDCRVPSLRGRQFVGGYLLPTDFQYQWPHPFSLDQRQWSRFFYGNLNRPRITFVGLDRAVFKTLLNAVRDGDVNSLAALEQQVVPETPEAVSFLRDGTLICSVDYMSLVDTIQL